MFLSQMSVKQLREFCIENRCPELMVAYVFGFQGNMDYDMSKNKVVEGWHGPDKNGFMQEFVNIWKK